MTNLTLNRCGWCTKDELYMHYHDTEWGVPVKDDQTMFEFLILETFQAGLSWYTILKKRENFREAFFQFDAEKMASISDDYYQKLMNNAGIIRNQGKIRGAIENARLYLEHRNVEGDFCDLMWSFTKGKTITPGVKSIADLKATSAESDAMSKALKKMGFKFVGSTVCYAHMQATGMVNDHVTDCFRYKELLNS